MAIDERARHELHRKLEEVLGPEGAATLMAHLPPVGWADVATKHDVAQLEERMNLRFEMVNERIDSLEERMNLRFEEQDARFEGKLDSLEGRIYDRMAKQSRATVLAFLGSSVTFASLVFAARLV